jgi:hypothetical protein
MRHRTLKVCTLAFLLALSSAGLAKKGSDDSDDRHGGGGILLTQVQHVEFGVLPAGAQRCSLNANGSLVGDCIGSGVMGEIEVVGEPYYAYDVNVYDIGWVNNKIFRPVLNKQNYYLNGKGRDRFYVRGEVRFKPGFNQSGIIVFNYQITVNYQ